MRAAWKGLRSFWNAEEIPRWFGMSVVLVYLFGLGAIAYFGLAQVRQKSRSQLDRAMHYAVTALADRLSAQECQSEAGLVSSRFKQELYEFAGHFNTNSVRVVTENRIVIASVDEVEVGSSVEDPIPGGQSIVKPTVATVGSAGGASAITVYRIPIGSDAKPLPMGLHGSDVDGGSQEPKVANSLSSEEEKGESAVVFLEVVVPPSFEAETAIGASAEAAIAILVGFGVLLVLYRCVRRQMKGVAAIATRLRSHGDSIRSRLGELHVIDSTDEVTDVWNQLVDLAQELSKSVEHNRATGELAKALSRSSEGGLADVINSLPDGVIHITDEERIAYFNSTAGRLLGWTSDAAPQSLSSSTMQGVGNHIVEVVQAALRDDGNFAAQTEVVSEDSENHDNGSHYRVWVIPLKPAENRSQCMVLIRDISQQLRADRAREDFVTQVTHELRTPLTNIRAYAETLSSGMFDDPSVITNCYNVITKETRRLSRLIEDILSVSQLEVGGISLEMGNVDVKALLTDGVRDVRGVADEKNIDIQIALPAKLDTLRADRDKLAVVVNNLLGNAIKYTMADGNVLVGCQMTTDAIVLTVKDNGMGIDPSDHARVFGKFQRGRDPELENITGTGIGLYTSREIIRRHGGDISVISEKGEGSTFMVRLPHRASRASSLSVTEES